MGKQLEKSKMKAASRIYIIGCWISTFGIYFVFGLLAVYSGSGAVQAFVKSIPVDVINGLSAAANLLPAIGFAMLLKMIISKKMSPSFYWIYARCVFKVTNDCNYSFGCNVCNYHANTSQFEYFTRGRTGGY